MTTPSRTRARTAVHLAIKEGRLIRQACAVCGEEKSEAHHEDYARPLDVQWLCRLHHRWHHAYGLSIDEMRRERTAA